MLAEMMPILTPGIHLNALQLFDSMLKVKETADTIVPLHESEYLKVEQIS